MLQGQLVLAHLRKNGANVQVNVAGVRDLEALIDGLLTEVQIVVLDLESFLEVAQRTSELFGAAEDTGEVVVGDGPVAVTFLSQTHGLVQQLK